MFDTAAGLGKVVRSEILPMIKSKGFNLSVSTKKQSYYHDGEVNVNITKVPSNFPVWIDSYGRYSRTKNAERLLETIKLRINTLISTQNEERELHNLDGLDIDLEVHYDRKIPFIDYEEK